MSYVSPIFPHERKEYYVLYEDSARFEDDHMVAQFTNPNDAVECAMDFIRDYTDGKWAVSYDRVKVVYNMDGWHEVVMWQYRKPITRP